MSSKTFQPELPTSPKLTLDNLSEELQKWKQPFLAQARQTAKQFQKKVKEHRKSALENVQTFTAKLQQSSKSPTPISQPSQKHIPSANSVQNTSPHTSVPPQQKYYSQYRQISSQQKLDHDPHTHTHTHIQPKLQQWKPNIDYGFKDHDQLIKNYGEVFKKKQKVKNPNIHKQEQEGMEDFRADQREMVTMIYKDLRDPKTGTVSFTEIQQFFQSYDLFYYFYNIHPYRLLNILRQIARTHENKLTKQQFYDLFLIDRPTVSQFKNSTQKYVCGHSILQQQIWKKLKNIFDTLDTFGNEKICIKVYFNRIRSNPSCISLLSAQAIQFPEINRVYTLEKVLFDLENKMQFQNKVDWDTIQDLISNFIHIQEPTLDIILNKQIQKAKIYKDSNYFLLEPKILDTIKHIFNRCPKYCDSFVKTSFFSYELLQAGILKPYMNYATRLQNSTRNQFLSLEQVIKQFSKEAPAYIDMDQMLEFISIKGSQNSKKLINLYDQIQSQSSQQETAQSKLQRKLKKIKSLEQLKKATRKKSKKKQLHETTRIKQFNLFKRQAPTIREQKVQQMIREKQTLEDIQLQKKFKANPIPVSLNSERYQKYAKYLQKKKESIINRLGIKREKDQIILDYLKTNTKLFEEKKNKKHCQTQKDHYVYEVTPLPLHISQELLPKIEAEKNQRRKRLEEETIKKYKEGYWKNIRENTEINKDDSLLQQINLIEEKKKFEQIKANEVPNFQQLHRKFQQQLEHRKQRFQPTRIQQFKLSSPSPKHQLKSNQSPTQKSPSRLKTAYSPKHNQNITIKSTKKFNDLVAYNQAKVAERQLVQMQKQRQKQQRLIKQKNFAKFMRKYLLKCTDNTDLLRHKSQQKLRRFREHVNQLQNETSEQLAQIYARVLQKPFLFQQANVTRKPTTGKGMKQRPKRVNNGNGRNNGDHHYQQQHGNVKGGMADTGDQGHGDRNQLMYKGNLFQKEDQEFHPIQSQNLNQSF